jgi:hypothetical protein
MRMHRLAARCGRCGSDLGGRRKGTTTRRFQGIVYRVDLYVCGCQRKRYVKRAVVA